MNKKEIELTFAIEKEIARLSAQIEKKKQEKTQIQNQFMPDIIVQEKIINFLKEELIR